jgi:hypothetical protein
VEILSDDHLGDGRLDNRCGRVVARQGFEDAAIKPVAVPERVVMKDPGRGRGARGVRVAEFDDDLGDVAGAR